MTEMEKYLHEKWGVKSAAALNPVEIHRVLRNAEANPLDKEVWEAHAKAVGLPVNMAYADYIQHRYYLSYCEAVEQQQKEMHRYLWEVYHLKSISDMSPSHALALRGNCQFRRADDVCPPNHFPIGLEMEVWREYANLHGLPVGMTYEEYKKSHHFLSYYRSGKPPQRRREEITFILNLDALSVEELETAATAFNQLAAYASTKRRAMMDRAQGEIQDAIKQEELCERFYDALPTWAKW